MTLPDKVVTLAREYDSGARTPVEARPAATVLLLRPGARGPEVYLLNRQTTMSFAAGMCVFPGGGVDPRDSDAEVAWAGPSPADWAGRLGCSEHEARALVAAAVRETFEESGVLLAGPSADAVISDVSTDEWEADRVALESRELSLSELLDRRGLVLRTDLLAPWAAWTTPVFEPRRYRTWFFVAELPAGQTTRDVSSESTSVLWLAAGEAVVRAERSELAMMPPTYLNSLDVARFAGPAEVLAEGRTRRVQMFTPGVEAVDGGHVFSLPPELESVVAERHSGGAGR